MRRIVLTIASYLILSTFFLTSTSAYWIWTPGTKKFVNPKYAVKDSPKEQFDWAMSFYDSKDYARSAAEFEKLTKQYEYSEYAAKSQYYIGLCYENMGKYYTAFQNYQKAVDNFPNIDNIDEIVARQFNIANIYAKKENPKVLGAEIMTSSDRVAEIYKKVVENAPYGNLADKGQFAVGEMFKKSERYDEAVIAFQKVVDDYPSSDLIEKARFEVADCAYKASLKPAYDAEPTDKAIKTFEEFVKSNRDKELIKDADKTLKRLRDKSAEKLMMTAQFYEQQKHYKSAIIYYQEVMNKFSDSSMADTARAKIERLNMKIERPREPITLDIRRPAEKPKPGPGAWKPFKLEKEPRPEKAAIPASKVPTPEPAAEKKVEKVMPEKEAKKPEVAEERASVVKQEVAREKALEASEETETAEEPVKEAPGPVMKEDPSKVAKTATRAAKEDDIQPQLLEEGIDYSE